ncbi:MAG TPA: hypothetical protein VNB23_07615 [Ramlibacter sp.]|nr:hypothetical protein [Ramlibacter sp.]
MSLLSWFSAKKKHDAVASLLPSSGLSRIDSTKPYHAAARGLHGTAQPANRKQERMERRELLYAVVRECMVRSGVLSSSYKFKVLSLDPRGRQFMVMVDLAYGGGADTNRLAEIEAMVAQSAKSRHDILVSAVYWRANEHVAVGDPAHHRPPISRPAPLTEIPKPSELKLPVSRPAPLAAETPKPAERKPAPAPMRVDPLQAEEVEAFKKALAAGVRGEQALAAVNDGKAHGQGGSYTLLTGFEDTEMTDGEPGGDLSTTQYGALR